MSAPVLASRDLGPATEREIASHILRTGLVAAPVVCAIAAAVWGWAGLASVGLAVAIVLANLWISAALLAWAARTSLGLLMGVALFGFLIRFALIAGIVLGLQERSWVRPVPLGLTLVGTHLGLLVWETRFVSASLAYPGLKPSARTAPKE